MNVALVILLEFLYISFTCGIIIDVLRGRTDRAGRAFVIEIISLLIIASFFGGD